MTGAKEGGSVFIRKVWSSNLEEEFSIIEKLLPLYPYAAFDTEFPGTVYPLQVDPSMVADPELLYQNLKLNVDNTNIIQLGLTLFNAKGELPIIGESYGVWEFNFNDFDLSWEDLHNSPSIQLLKKQGLDFNKLARDGISSAQFASFLVRCGLLANPCFRSNSYSIAAWVGFHSAYDFGYIIKMLTGKKLPSELHTFMSLVKYFFGTHVYDLKYMIKHCSGLYGGLEKVAKKLQVVRVAGKPHQAGSDSLVTMMSFIKTREYFFNHLDGEQFSYIFGGVLHGLVNNNLLTLNHPRNIMYAQCPTH